MNRNVANGIAIFAGTALYGVAPILLAPNIPADPKGDLTFPWPVDIAGGQMAVLMLTLPLVFMALAVLRGRLVHHGLWAALMAAALVVKLHDMPATLPILFGIIVFGSLNYYAFTQLTDRSYRDALKERFAHRQKVMTQASGNDDDFGRKSSTIMFPAIRPTSTFDDLVGMQDVKDRLLKAGKEIVTKKGARNGILLTGEPGNGKTAIAKALAGSLKLPLISVSFGDFQSRWVGQTTERVMKVFDDAETQAPCMLFIDESEALMFDRETASNGDSEGSKTVTAILTRIVDLRSKGVVLVGATNYIEKMDKAAIREGRFDYKIEITPPDFPARKFLLTQSLGKHASKLDEATLERVAKRWEGFSVSRIRAIGQETVDALVDGKINKIGFEELMNSLRAIQSSKGNKIPENTPSLDDLILSDEMRDRLRGLIHRMTNIESIEEMGGTVPGGILFAGPAGTGKSTLATVLAKETGWAFISTTGQDLLADAGAVDKVIAKAKDLRPVIVFIDEGDDVLADRRMSPMSKTVTNKLITAMDGAGGRVRDVLYVAATNSPDMIDAAALRGGRFTEKIWFTLPSSTEINEFVAKWKSKSKAKFAEDYNQDMLVSMLEGQSLANVNEILQTAVNLSIGKSQPVVGMKELTQAIETVVA
jgi:transitional endoplasmic reticulum ATPase